MKSDDQLLPSLFSVTVAAKGGKDRFPFPPVLAVENPVEFKEIPDGGSSPDEDAQSLDGMRWQPCEVGDCFLADPASFPPGFPEECDPVSVMVSMLSAISRTLIWELLFARWLSVKFNGNVKTISAVIYGNNMAGLRGWKRDEPLFSWGGKEFVGRKSSDRTNTHWL
ncbi:MAG: hypothetical protein OXD45_08890 [Rhodobacteraceae bacterium]|nr:hypothetical protein [Paracoccaceae bacterium]